MIVETVDLYAEYGVPRRGNEGGKLTVYHREPYTEIKPKLRPAVLVIPGGGYVSVSQREGEPVALRFLGEGYVAAVLTYTICKPYPVPLVEAALAMAYLRDHAASLWLDPEKVAAIGFSAGGHLLGLLSTYRDGEAADVPAGKRIRPDASVYAYAVLTTWIDTHGGTAKTISGGDEALKEALSIDRRVGPDCPPAFFWHTAADGAVPVAGALRTAEAYKQAGVPFELHVYEKGHHGIVFANREGAPRDEGAVLSPHIETWFVLLKEFLEDHGFFVRVA